MDRRRWILVGIVVLLALLTTVWIVPAVVVSAYNGESFDVLNRMISGQGSHPVERYLRVWNSLAVRVWGLALGLAALWVVRSTPVGRATGRFLSREPVWTGKQVVGAACLFGVFAGVGQGSHEALRFLIEHHPSRWFQWEAVWMAPISAALAFAVLAAGAWAALRLWQGPGAGISTSTVVFGLGLFAAFSVVQDSALGLHPLAGLVLSAGFGSVLARSSSGRSDGGWLWIRRARTPVFVGLIASTALGLFMLPRPLERRRLADLTEARAGLPNVLLIILDTVRASSMSLYGHYRPTTPFLERWAGRGVVFSNAISPSSWTLPAHASLFTGRWPHELTAGLGVPLDRTYPTLAEIMAERGYQTAGFSANWGNASESTGLARGFLRYEDFPVGWGRFLVSSWSAKWLANRIFPLSRPEWQLQGQTARQNSNDFLGWWAEADQDRPFFAFLNYMDAHAPYASPPEYRERFPSDQPVIQPTTERMDSALLEGTRAAYDASIAYLDAELERLFALLEADGAMANTVVVVTSDHGEQFGEHGLMDHGNSLYEPLIRVPLVVVFPPGLPAGATVDASVTTRDLAATLTELTFGEPDPRLGGESLTRHLDTHLDADGTPPRTPVLATLRNPNVQGIRSESSGPGDMVSVVSGTDHYIRTAGGGEELYDWSADPRGLRNLADQPDQQPMLRLLAQVVDSLVEGSN